MKELPKVTYKLIERYFFCKHLILYSTKQLEEFSKWKDQSACATAVKYWKTTKHNAHINLNQVNMILARYEVSIPEQETYHSFCACDNYLSHINRPKRWSNELELLMQQFYKI